MQRGSLSLSADAHGSAASLPRGESSTSAVFNSIVPRFLQRRLSPIRSLRDLATTYIRPGGHQRQNSTSSNSSNTSAPPPYSEDPPSSDEDDMDAEFASAPSSRPSSSGSASANTSHLALLNAAQSAEDLIRFKFANQGLLLVAQSAQELRTNPNANNEYQRRLYLDGVAYLLRALPEGLTESERAGLQAALPIEVVREEHAGAETNARERQGKEPRRTAFSVTIAILVFWSFFAFATALPYFRLLVRTALEFERKHRLGEHTLNRSLALLQITYAQLITIVCAVWAYNDGMIGQKLTEFGVWCAENIGEGVRDGLREAAAALRRSQDDN